jgi:hypothetical protein
MTPIEALVAAMTLALIVVAFRLTAQIEELEAASDI